MKLKEGGDGAPAMQRPHINWAKGNWGTATFLISRPSWLHRSALLLELAGGNHWSRALLGWR